MNEPRPPKLFEVDDRVRCFPPSWRDAAIRIRFDISINGVRCAACNEAHVGLGKLKKLVADHIYPWSAGGLTVWENMELLCPRCNSKKSSKISS